MMGKLIRWPMLALLRFYQLLISPLLNAVGVRCRHEPTCSTYATEAIKRYGVWFGGWMTVARLLRCQPFDSLGATCGVDHVPQVITKPPFWAPWRIAVWRGTISELN